MAAQAHCLFAFDVLECHLAGERTHKTLHEWQQLSTQTDGRQATLALMNNEAAPIFVTWNTQKGNAKRLRGCIGTFSAQPLEESLASYSIIAAVRDTRFRPIQAKELPTLSCGISILSTFEPIDDPFDWTIGKHGLQVHFMHRGRGRSATYLPQVAEEQGWTKEETLESLLQKGGFDGLSDWRKLNLDLERYQSSKHELSHAEYEIVKAKAETHAK